MKLFKWLSGFFRPVSGKWVVFHWVLALSVSTACAAYFWYYPEADKKRWRIMENENILKKTELYAKRAEQLPKWELLLTKQREKATEGPDRPLYFLRPETGLAVLQTILSNSGLNVRHQVAGQRQLEWFTLWSVDVHWRSSIDDILGLLEKLSERFGIEVQLIEKIKDDPLNYKAGIRVSFLIKRERLEKSRMKR